LLTHATEVHEAEAAPTEDDWKTYKVELSDPEVEDRMEIISAESDERAIQQAYEFTNEREGVLLLEVLEMDADYNEIRNLDLPPNPYRLTISLPTDGFSPEKIELLGKLVASKETLLKAALGADSLPIQLKDGALHFPWFRSQNGLPLSADETEAYATFISLLCTTAKEKKRVNGKDKQIETSQKFAMRVFLLSLGMIGSEYKLARKILLRNLSGSAAWPNGKPNKAAETPTEVAEAEA